ncbi:potential autophagy related protein Atg2 [Pseudozyma hubeiensis SY62]|uniref:Autophagy-related protein 2 n=1 Tax=Pseudozyma hubeiensis (strain SY62) TaxID=1305764 RepID=R9P6U8_PSEHS|nr:potential autophagy related protein Atg2 [Pseudozyma hubeiensis SY62]GAC97086.1 potential autophagy related protein Atg2 [Pseudozyma hubeiensis SY62]
MASYLIPSFLTGWDLSSVSAFSLSANLQKRILSYLLKRTLGHLVDGGQLDLAQIDAGIGSGRIEVRNVQLDAQAINRRLPSLPITFVAGKVGSILIQLPVPNFWSGDLSVTISDLVICIAPSSRYSAHDSNPVEDLSASFASAASQLFVDDEEARDIEQSIHESLDSEALKNEQQPSQDDKGSLIATYVEALLTRLKVVVENVHIHLQSDALDLTLKLDRANVRSSNTRTEQQEQYPQSRNTQNDTSDTLPSPQRRFYSKTERTLDLHGFEIWLQDKTQTQQEHDPDSSSSSDDSFEDDVSHLRQSERDLARSVVSLQESNASLYESAIGEFALEEASGQAGPTPSRKAESRSTPEIPAGKRQRLFSLGQEPVVVTFKTIKERHETYSSGAPSRRQIQRLVSVVTDVDVQIGNMVGVIFIDHVNLLLSLTRSFDLTSARPSTSSVQRESRAHSRTAGPRAPIQRDLTFSCQAASFNLIVGYDEPSEPQQDQSFLEAFWARPARIHPDFGHLRLRCDKLSARFTGAVASGDRSNTRANVQFAVEDLGVFEHLSGSLYEQCPPESLRILPVLILDPALAHLGTAAPAASKQPQHDYARSTVDVFDWRYNAFQTSIALHPPAVGNTQNPAKAARFTATDARPNSSSSVHSPYVRTAYGDRAWKLKATAKSSPHSKIPDVHAPLIDVSIFLPQDSEGQGRVNVTVAPVHFFVDVSLVTRVMPALRRFAATQIAALRPTAKADHDLNDSVATLASSAATIQASTDSLLDGLDTDVAAVRRSPYRLDLDIGFVRIDVRTPKVSYDTIALAGRSLSSTRLHGLDRRSGILVIQIQHLQVLSGLAETHKPAGAVRFAASLPQSAGQMRPSKAVVTGRVNAEKVSAYLALPLQSRALILALMEAVDDSKGTNGPFASSHEVPLPRLHFSRMSEPAQSRGNVTNEKERVTDQCSILVPSIKVELRKAQLDSLQYVADDLTQSVNLWTSDDLGDSDPLDSEGLKILGSRFFGSRAGLSVMSSSTDSTATARGSSNDSSLHLTIVESSIRLWLPSLSPSPGSSGDERTDSAKSLLLTMSGSELLFDSDKTRNTNRIEIRIPEAQLSVEAGDFSEETSSSLLAYRTMGSALDDRRSAIMLLLVFEAYAEPGTSYREQNVDINLSSMTLAPPFDEELLPRIKRLLKSPAGVFENVEPNEVTRISFKARDCSVFIAPPDTQHRAAVAIGEASVKTKLTSHAPKTSIKLAIASLGLFAAEADPSLASSRPHFADRSAPDRWTRRGYARVLHVPESKASVHLTTLTRPEIDVKVTKLRVKIQATADTLSVVSDLISAASSKKAQEASRSPSQVKEPALSTKPEQYRREDLSEDLATAASTSDNSGHFDRMVELMSDIEDNAYRLEAPLPVAADLVDDDVPSDAAFLGTKERYHPEIVETTLDSDEFFGGESVASISLLEPRADTVIFADEDVTVRLLDPKGICPVQDYFTDPDLRPHLDSALGTTASSARVRVSNFDLSMRLHSGYDWPSTRKAIQQEAKLVRRRLQKIKQLLAEGQVPDDSVEAATSNLLDSIHISLPNVAAEMDADEMMRAVEEELGDGSDAVSAADSDATASWQALPNVKRDGRAFAHGRQDPAADASHDKLQRSVRSSIDFNFRGLEVEFDKADASQPGHVVSRIAVNARRFEIIDNIKTSTWRTFLTEMQDRNAALRHDAESKMVKVEILHVRPQGDVREGTPQREETPEVRMRAKLAPLRLHVDQDALDFLKKFFTFQTPGRKESEIPPTPAGAAPLPFVQFAEVLPIKIKLDYKPKRVDYNLLRQGKTIELMNFFHFEGSEMVLRHVTLRGINGWARLFDTLNDIWTPDVKANQLADFLSGLGPIRSLVNVGAGLADLVLLPIEQYHKDGRVLRGVQRGATSFAKSTALEAAKLGARLATGTQVILEQAEHILGGERMDSSVTARAVGPESGESYESLSESVLVESTTLAPDRDSLVSRYASKPEDMTQALSQAYSGLTEGLTSAAQTILAIPMEVYDPSDARGASGGGGAARGAGSGRGPVVKAVPIAILKGAQGATQAIAKTMQGVQVTLGDLENVKEGKYKLPPSTSGAGRRGR